MSQDVTTADEFPALRQVLATVQSEETGDEFVF
jgi:hypothetical protein